MSDAHEPLCIPESFWTRSDVCEALRSRDIGALFTLVRRHTGASQTRIGIAVDMEQATISKIFNGNRSVVALDVIERIADGLGMPDAARCGLGLAPTGLMPPPAGVDFRPPDQDGRGGGSEPVPGKGRNDRLYRLFTESGMSRAGLAKRVNDLGALMGVEVRYDYTYVYRWIDKGQRPRDPGPHLIATVLAQALDRPVSVQDIGMGDDSRPVSPLGVEDLGTGDDSDGASVEPSRADAGLVGVAAGPGLAVRVAVSVDGVPATGGADAYGVWVVLAGPLPLPVNAQADAVAQGPPAAGMDGARVYWLADERRRRGGRAG